MIKTIGFLGCGNMGGAIARAVCKAADPQNIYLAHRTAAQAEALDAELGCNTTTNAEVAGRSEPVSYTHLTLPTISAGVISVVGVRLKANENNACV